MKNLKFFAPALAALVAALAQVPAQAGFANFCSQSKGSSGACTSPTTTTIVTPAGKRRSDAIFMGINWNFGSKVPELVVGLRSLKTGVQGRAYGAQLDLILPFLGGITFDRVRLMYVGGQRSSLGQLGFGYSFAQQTPLLAAGVQVPNVTFGLDYLFKGTALPYVGLNSLNRPKLPTGGTSSTTVSCAAPSVLTPVTAFGSAPVEQVNGQTCYTEQQQNND